MPSDPKQQFHHAFQKIGSVLEAAGLGFSYIVDMTSYHIDIRTHFDLFSSVGSHYVTAPFPTWTAIGVAELRRPGVLVEIKATARVQ